MTTRRVFMIEKDVNLQKYKKVDIYQKRGTLNCVIIQAAPLAQITDTRKNQILRLSPRN